MSSSSGNLGRGLGELFDEASYARTTLPAFEEGFARIPAQQIDLPDWMGARNRNGAALDDLAESIRQHGILQPLLVAKIDSRYMILSGARRYAAALRAGLQDIPVMIIAEKDNDPLALYLAENIQQLSLNLEDNALELSAICDHFNLTPDDLRQRIQELAPHTLQQALEEQAEAAIGTEADSTETPEEETEEPVEEEQAVTELPPPLPLPEESLREETENDEPIATDRYRPWFYAVSAALIISIVITIIAFGTKSERTIEVEKTVFVHVPENTMAVQSTETKNLSSATEADPEPTVDKTKKPNSIATETAASPVQPTIKWIIPKLPEQLKPPHIAGTKTTATAQRIDITFDQPVFSYRSEINAEAKQILQQIATALRPYVTQIEIQVSGHTDNDPITTSAYFSNYDLGLERAAAVAEYLHRAGILPTACISARSDGAWKAPYSNATPDTKRKNRTVTLQVLPRP